MKISILLPYKENFTSKYAGAVSLFVNDTTLNSKFKKNIHVFGNTKYKKPFLKNYINISLNKNTFQSVSKNYVKGFIYHEKKIKSDLIEIHNRPNYIKYLTTFFKKKEIFLYFHNDPLSMTGSKSVDDRLYLINNLSKIIFNSKWSQDRFFLGINNNQLLKQKTSICYQSTSKTNIDFNKKQKLISFIGKLNSAKGYDLFGKAILNILNKYPDWNAIVIGDEPREKLQFKHKNLDVRSFVDNKKILKILERVSISVICSRWEEPFGRTSLEAASRGSAVIISDRGGLKETSESAIVLKNLSDGEIFNEIENLILDNKKLKNSQKNNYKTFKFNHKFISKLIDDIRFEFIPKKINTTIQNKVLKILHITNFNERFNGRLHYNTGRRINNGFIRLGHNVLSLSDRDVLFNNKSINDFKGVNFLQNKILDISNNFKPDLVVLGHADKVSLSTLHKLKETNNNLLFTQWFLDPLSKYGPDHLNNKKRILDKSEILDTSFLTTDPNSLSFKIPKAFFIPNPSDPSFEILENYKFNCPNDVFFAMSHGVHRGLLKKGKTDNREIYINKLIKKNPDIKFDIYGMNDIQPVWGDNFISKISNSYMGLNLSRGKPIKYYSSDRLTQLIGNGLLTFIDERAFYSDFFSKNEMIFYSNIDDLSEKINKYKKDKKQGKKIAKNGKSRYFKYFNSTLVSDYIISKTFGIKSKNKFVWSK